MKTLIIILGSLLIALNLIAGAIFNDYHNFNFLFSNFSIISSIILIYLLTNSGLGDGIKIGVNFTLILLGAVKLVISYFIPNYFSNNYILMLFSGVLIIELAIFFTSKSLIKLKQ